jgi:hypothetical protein
VVPRPWLTKSEVNALYYDTGVYPSLFLDLV